MLKDNDYYEARIEENATMSDYSIEKLVERMASAGFDIGKYRICKVCYIDITAAVNLTVPVQSKDK
jgi:hypothetical protein